MVQALLNGILILFTVICGFVGSIVFYPIQALLVTLLPSVGDFLTSILSFFNDFIFPFICWLKQVIINITCCPPELFQVLVTTVFAYLSIAITMRTIILIINVYRFIKGGKTS